MEMGNALHYMENGKWEMIYIKWEMGNGNGESFALNGKWEMGNALH